MSFRERIITILEVAGARVIPWGHVVAGRFLIVRPAGVSEGERPLVEVWCINPKASDLTDPDVGLEDHMAATYRALRPHIINPEVAQAEYVVNPTSRGGNRHMALVITGSSPAPL